MKSISPVWVTSLLGICIASNMAQATECHSKISRVSMCTANVCVLQTYALWQKPLAFCAASCHAPALWGEVRTLFQLAWKSFFFLMAVKSLLEHYFNPLLMYLMHWAIGKKWWHSLNWYLSLCAYSYHSLLTTPILFSFADRRMGKYHRVYNFSVVMKVIIGNWRSSFYQARGKIITVMWQADQTLLIGQLALLIKQWVRT